MLTQEDFLRLVAQHYEHTSIIPASQGCWTDPFDESVGENQAMSER